MVLISFLLTYIIKYVKWIIKREAKALLSYWETYYVITLPTTLDLKEEKKLLSILLLEVIFLQHTNEKWVLVLVCLVNFWVSSFFMYKIKKKSHVVVSWKFQVWKKKIPTVGNGIKLIIYVSPSIKSVLLTHLQWRFQ